MSHQVALSFEDGVTRFITCADGQTVADASYRSRINIPLDCRDGACGTCKAFCESGDYDGGTYIDDALSPDESKAGYCLPCSMTPKSDLVLQIASSSAVAKTQAATYAGRLTALDRLSPTTTSLTVEVPNRDQLTFLPGQYVSVAVPGTDETRSYSFSSGPQDERLSFLVKHTPGGVMSEYLADRARVGDELTFTGPKGSFFLRESERPILLLAGGTGPRADPLDPAPAERGRQQAPGPPRLRRSTDDDLVELETIETLAAELGTLTWDYCVADPASSAPNKGYVTSLLRPEHLHDGDVAVYLCGPPPMVEAVRSALHGRGRPADRLLLREVRPLRGRHLGGGPGCGPDHRAGRRAAGGRRAGSRCRAPDHLGRPDRSGIAGAARRQRSPAGGRRPGDTPLDRRAGGLPGAGECRAHADRPVGTADRVG